MTPIPGEKRIIRIKKIKTEADQRKQLRRRPSYNANIAVADAESQYIREIRAVEAMGVGERNETDNLLERRNVPTHERGMNTQR